MVPTMPSRTFPNTTCLPSSHEDTAVQMKNLHRFRIRSQSDSRFLKKHRSRQFLGGNFGEKLNCEPLVSGPELAIETVPGPV
jgi:hypothetical protein